MDIGTPTETSAVEQQWGFSFFSTRHIFLNHLKRRVNVGRVTLAMFDQYCNVFYKALEKHYWYLIFLAIFYLKAKVSAALIASSVSRLVSRDPKIGCRRGALILWIAKKKLNTNTKTNTIAKHI